MNIDTTRMDAVVACADLVGRAGGKAFEVGYLRDDVPVADAGWYATAFFKGARLICEEQRSPEAAADGLAHRLLDGAQCTGCHKRVGAECRWHRNGQKWVRGCDGKEQADAGRGAGMRELLVIVDQLERAERPEEVFGGDPHRMYLRLAKLVHPDRYLADVDKAFATSGFKRLTALWEIAQQRIEAGIYGTDAALMRPFTARSKRGTYTVKETIGRGDVCDLYRCEDGAVLKVAQQPRDNELVTNEARVLRKLASGEHAIFRRYVPSLIDSFGIRQSGKIRQANVLSSEDGFYTLADLAGRFPDGLPARDVAWMWRRLLTALGFAHANGVVHGAVLPQHVMVHPLSHGLILLDWTASGAEGDRLRVVADHDRSFYPPEIFEKQNILAPSLDIYMGAMTMADLLDANTPKPIHAFLNGCVLRNAKQRPDDAWQVKEEFDDLIEKLWGKRTYRPLVVPA